MQKVLEQMSTIFLDTSRNADGSKYSRRQVTHRRNDADDGDEAGLMLDDVNANYNKGFAARKVLLGASAVVNCDPRTLTRCHLEVGNGNKYPRIHYKPTQDASRVFRDVMKYVNANNDLQGGTLLNISKFKELYPFVYFDLTKQKTDIKDGVTKLSFHYELSDTTTTNYVIYGLVLHEEEAELEKESGKLLLRA